jgi:hypothetical protein
MKTSCDARPKPYIGSKSRRDLAGTWNAFKSPPTLVTPVALDVIIYYAS